MNIRYIKAHEPFTVHLKGKPSTGYIWKYKEIPGIKMLLMRETVDSPGIIGSTTTVTFTFQAESSGEYKLEIVNIRPWENNNIIERFEEVIAAE